MEIFNTSSEYGSIAKLLHWVVSIFILTLLVVGYIMAYVLPEAYQPMVFNVHKLVGLSVLFLVFVRISWLGVNDKPISLSVKRWERILEKSVHFLLYAMMLVMPLSGWIMSTAEGYIPHFFKYSFPMPGIAQHNKSLAHFAGNIHGYAAWILIALLVLHIGGALKHHFINKDQVLKRMLPNQE